MVSPALLVLLSQCAHSFALECVSTAERDGACSTSAVEAQEVEEASLANAQLLQVKSAARQKWVEPSKIVYGYKDLGFGGCLLPDGNKPKSAYHSYEADLGMDACDYDADCKGYNVETGCRGTYLWFNPKGTIKGGGPPPAEGHVWKEAPCFQKLEDFKYQVQEGYGKCKSSTGAGLQSEWYADASFVDRGPVKNPAYNEPDCRFRCTKDPSCKGYSAARNGWAGCFLWKSDGLVGGGDEWLGSRCVIKVSALPNGPNTPSPTPAPTPFHDEWFDDAGEGKCSTRWGKAPSSKPLDDGVSADAIRKKCIEDPTCMGYSANTGYGGFLWTQLPLWNSGGIWGDARCFVKKITYVDKGYGKCKTASGTEPANSYEAGVEDADAQYKCSMDPKCKGYSRSWKGAYFWTEESLKVPDPPDYWNGAKCMVKELPQAAGQASGSASTATVEEEKEEVPPAEPEVQYEDKGSGKCRMMAGYTPQYKYVGSVGADELKAKCTDMPECTGYSASKYGGGLLYKEGPLQGGGYNWGGCHCIAKK